MTALRKPATLAVIGLVAIGAKLVGMDEFAGLAAIVFLLYLVFAD